MLYSSVCNIYPSAACGILVRHIPLPCIFLSQVKRQNMTLLPTLGASTTQVLPAAFAIYRENVEAVNYCFKGFTAIIWWSQNMDKAYGEFRC